MTYAVLHLLLSAAENRLSCFPSKRRLQGSRGTGQPRAFHKRDFLSRFPSFSFFLFFFQFFVFYFKETHTHTLSRKQDLSYQLTQSPNHTPSAHFPAQRTSPSQGPRRCGLTRGCPIKRIYFLELKNICGKVDYHLAAHQQLLKTGL